LSGRGNSPKQQLIDGDGDGDFSNNRTVRKHNEWMATKADAIAQYIINYDLRCYLECASSINMF
jgi:hypothetical protein